MFNLSINYIIILKLLFFLYTHLIISLGKKNNQVKIHKTKQK